MSASPKPDANDPDETLDSQAAHQAAHQTEVSPDQTLPSHHRRAADSGEILGLDETRSDEKTPSQMGRYHVIRLLGEGAFGRVYLALDPQLDRKVAIKVAKSLTGATQVKRFLREARSAARLHHPNIIPVYEYGTFESENLIVYEYVPGETLKSFLKRHKKLPVAKAVEVLQKIAAGLAYAHEQGIVHRDMKPDNVLINAAGEPHIADFGCARSLNDDVSLTIDGSVLGTPMYMSPEQASGNSGTADGRTDVWSLGVMLYEMVSGEKPFTGSLNDLLFAICNTDPVRLRKHDPGLPRDIETICHKCLARKPEERFYTASELVDELARYQRGEPILSRPLGPLARTWRWANRHRAVATLLTLVVLTMLVGTIVSTSFALQAYREQRSRAFAQMDSLRTAESPALPAIFEAIAPFRTTILPQLKQRLLELDSTDGDPQKNAPDARRLRMAIIQLETDPNVRSQIADQMLNDLLAAEAGDLIVCRDCLAFHQEKLKSPLWEIALATEQSVGKRFRAATALALYDPDAKNWEFVAADVSGYLTSLYPIQVAEWLPALLPVRESLKPHLIAAFKDSADRSSPQPERAAAILASLFSDQADFIAELIPIATPPQIPYLTHELKRAADSATKSHDPSVLLQQALQRELKTPADVLAHANAKIANLQIGSGLSDHDFSQAGDPSVATGLIENLARANTPAEVLLTEALLRLDGHVSLGNSLRTKNTTPAADWRSVNPDKLAGVLLSLGQYHSHHLLESQRQRLKPTLLEIFSTHPHARVHASASWLLDQWNYNTDRIAALEKLKQPAPDPEKSWHVDLAGNTFALTDPVGAFGMGLPPKVNDSGDFDSSKILDEPWHKKRIPRRFGICLHEVTIGQYEAFENAEVARITALREASKDSSPDDTKALRRLELKLKEIERVQNRRRDLDKTLPVGDVDFFSALAYCRWLSEQQQTEFVLPSVESLGQIRDSGTDLAITAEMLDRTGYRLPTATEWEFACRGGSQTLFPFGRHPTFADRYAWFASNSNARLHPVGQLKPSGIGLFDMQGNVSEWCLDWYREDLPKIPAELNRSFYIDGGPEFADHRGLDRELRGASYLNEIYDLRSSYRSSTRPHNGFPRLGFRLARTYPSE